MKNMNRDELINIVGRIGEKIIGNMLRDAGHDVRETIDNFDSKKDLIVDGNILVEVKTEQPYIKRNAITFRENQLKKCRNVDALFFVSVPPLMNESYKWGGWIFKVDPKNFVCEKYQTKFGTRMIAIPIEQESVIPVRKLTEEELSYIKPYLTSDYAK
jgi:hypothetical protein